MRIAFYAPLKPPDHPRPSGDRRMARQMVAALRLAGHRVELASRLRSLDLAGSPAAQAGIRARAEREVADLTRRFGAGAPDLWFTYHLYHKAPDWIGPALARTFRLPYVVAEASHAPRRAHGPWAAGHDAAVAALRQARTVFHLTAADRPALAALIRAPTRLLALPPFLDLAAFPVQDRGAARRALGARLGVPADGPWALTVAMMRAGAKQRSYEQLAAALGHLTDLDWRLLVAGDGPAGAAVRAAFRPLGDRVAFLGLVAETDLAELYAAADLFLWPAVDEAYGMAFLEAAAMGVPAVAGRHGGVAEVVADGRTGLLVAPDDDAAFAAAVARLLADADLRLRLGAAACRIARAERGLAAAAERLEAGLRWARA